MALARAPSHFLRRRRNRRLQVSETQIRLRLPRSKRLSSHCAYHQSLRHFFLAPVLSCPGPPGILSSFLHQLLHLQMVRWGVQLSRLHCLSNSHELAQLPLLCLDLFRTNLLGSRDRDVSRRKLTCIPSNPCLDWGRLHISSPGHTSSGGPPGTFCRDLDTVAVGNRCNDIS